MTITTGRTEALTRADGSPVRALVVDDEPSLAELPTLALRHEGWQAQQAFTGQEAVRLAEEVDPDVVLLDAMLPDISGLEVLTHCGPPTGSPATSAAPVEIAAALRGQTLG